MVEFVAFNVIIDDIVCPDGRTHMGVLGGGGPQTAFGMRLWSEGVGIVSGIGDDLPESAWRWFEEMGVDTAGLRPENAPTARAWQVLEADGRRTQVWRVPWEVVGRHLWRTVDVLPGSYRDAVGFHMGVHPEAPNLGFIEELRGLGENVISVEPFRVPSRPLTDAERAGLLGCADVFSPNVSEVIPLVRERYDVAVLRLLTEKGGSRDEMVQLLVEGGAKVVALRMGKDGSIVYDSRTGEGWRIPAVPVEVVDPVGAGNAFCGGFIAGWAKERDVRLAGMCGAVAASFLVEQVGLPAPRPGLWDEARSRLESLRGQVRPFTITA